MTPAQRATLEHLMIDHAAGADHAEARGMAPATRQWHQDRADALRAALGTCGTCAHADTIESPAGSVYCTLPGSWLSARRMPAEARCKDWAEK